MHSPKSGDETTRRKFMKKSTKNQSKENEHPVDRKHYVGLAPLRRHGFGQFQKTILHKFSVILHWFEVLLAVLSVAFVVIGVIYLILKIPNIFSLVSDQGVHFVLEDVLSDILLLVVGIELAIMLVRRTPESLVEVMFFVIARKILIKTDNFYEILIGVAALAGLFAIRKYLEIRGTKPITD